ncbi:CDP-alcohol phosphatidyltransferase family protein [SAR86 cluster bacterium]|nr:CDP-alcohol phosphatidyltransferase family protein [SAR86 cluster bacterium]
MKDYLIFIPNLISITRIILVYPILINFYNGHFFWSLSFFILASLSDALDGYLARTFNWQTELGKILDPIADKFLLIGMVLIFWLEQIIPDYVILILILRELIILLGASFHMTVYHLNTPQPNMLGKLFTLLLIIYVLFELLNVMFETLEIHQLHHIVISIACLISLFSYTINWIKLTYKLHNKNV